jgi:hypothetical protein
MPASLSRPSRSSSSSSSGSPHNRQPFTPAPLCLLPEIATEPSSRVYTLIDVRPEWAEHFKVSAPQAHLRAEPVDVGGVDVCPLHPLG